MTNFPDQVVFKFPWREYQQRVLDDFDHHFKDDHLHVVAPPGSGKTLLGLEIARRLNYPTLILAPTSAIRDQWVSRFCTFFLRTRDTPEWISTNINEPAFLTVSTYQGLHAAFTHEKNTNKGVTGNTVIKALNQLKVSTLVLDEAHHLKNAWWKTLTAIKHAVKPKVVGLTATPPYDSTALEWKKYSELNGPVDSEISIPELVKAGDLCPHQDFVILSEPTEEEHILITNRRKRVSKVFDSLTDDKSLIRAIESHPCWLEPENHLEWIYTNISNYSATLIFLNRVYGEIPSEKRKVIGDDSFLIPQFDYFWAERLLHFYLFQDEVHFLANEAHQLDLANRLKHYGVLHRKQITFTDDDKTKKILSTSVSKLESIQTVVDFEYGQLKDRLRCVILSDFIRKEIYGKTGAKTKIDQMGVVPIFEMLRRQHDPGYRLGVLTGSLVIISTKAVSRLSLLSQQDNDLKLTITPFDVDDAFAEVTSNNHHKLIQLITQLFEAGDIRVLVGTKSLLGEGWDAPSINALVLASFVGSFVLSNQMRGRAIRTQRDNGSKTANIWHLACYDKNQDSGGPDFTKLIRRFNTFAGVSYGDTNYITTGLIRMGIPEEIQSSEELEQLNINTFTEAALRLDLKHNWDKAIILGTKLVRQIKLPYQGPIPYQETKNQYFNQAFKYSGFTLLSSIALYAFGSLQVLAQVLKTADFRAAVMIALGTGTAFLGTQTVRAVNRLHLHNQITKDLGQIGKALLQTMIDLDLVLTSSADLKVITRKDHYGSVYCHLEGATMYEKSIFSEYLSELLAPIDNPKYIIMREDGADKGKHKYHSIPERLAKNVKQAKTLENNWRKLVGNCTLIYTRNLEGRKILVKSRLEALTSKFANPVEEISSWTK